MTTGFAPTNNLATTKHQDQYRISWKPNPYLTPDQVYNTSRKYQRSTQSFYPSVAKATPSEYSNQPKAHFQAQPRSYSQSQPKTHSNLHLQAQTQSPQPYQPRQVQKTKRNVTSEEKKYVVGRQQYRCANSPGSNLRGLENYRCLLWNSCGGIFDESGYEIDHIVELADGGKNDLDNLQALCVACHATKTNRFNLRNKKNFD